MGRARAKLRAVTMLFIPAALASCDPTDVLTHDVTPPSVTISGIANGETIIEDRGISVDASDADSDLIELSIFLDNQLFTTRDPNSKSAGQGVTLEGGPENAGNHTIGARAVDKAGNSRVVSLAYTVLAP